MMVPYFFVLRIHFLFRDSFMWIPPPPPNEAADAGGKPEATGIPPNYRFTRATLTLTSMLRRWR